MFTKMIAETWEKKEKRNQTETTEDMFFSIYRYNTPAARYCLIVAIADLSAFHTFFFV